MTRWSWNSLAPAMLHRAADFSSSSAVGLFLPSRCLFSPLCSLYPLSSHWPPVASSLQLVIGFESGIVVLWDLKSKKADYRYTYDEVGHNPAHFLHREKKKKSKCFPPWFIVLVSWLHEMCWMSRTIYKSFNICHPMVLLISSISPKVQILFILPKQNVTQHVLYRRQTPVDSSPWDL